MDFETHSIGTSREIQLSRTLTRAMADNMSRIQQYNVMPREVLVAYEELVKHYQWQIENQHD